MKKGFVLRKEKIYLLSREEKEEIYKFIKEYIKPLKLPQTAPLFFVGKIVKRKWFRTTDL